MIWAKTDAGRIEIQTRALVKERARRNLLLLIDGIKPDEALLGSLAGVGPEDFQALESLGLIAQAGAASRPASPDTRPGALTSSPRVSAPAAPAVPAPARPAAPAAASVPLDYAAFTAALTQLISSQLGLRGFVLTLAVEKAGTIEELQAVAQRTLEQIRDRKGEAAAAAARQTLYGR